ncbi:alpha/beta hydrolase [Actinomadura opuntiae]|uniref:alpha/beta hydrolase n=1 Tax=Actinomadura sp. OS1-43 TaxID=604315 RepID=UPI00255A8814|nr:alpha/beta hydrolase-fold protein [Actinomadura sp. OS1-43]MDL4817092.1 alpha/beta hydrolase-fold protein [Actinomadura sp. OS1-43]
MISRRALLIGGLGGLGAFAAAGGTGYALVENDVLPGRVRLDRALGRCGDVPAPPAASTAVRRLSWHSAHRRTDVTATVVLPAANRSLRGLPVAVALHGSGGDGASAVRSLALDHYLPDAVANGGVPPFAIAAIDGGPDSYWHPRADGEDPIGMIVDELLPRLGKEGAEAGRIGVIGWSMGGYGALVLARRLGASRTAAVVASSPALFASYGDAHRTNARSFDGAADFARNDVFTGLDALKGIPARVDCGTSDPFAPMVRKLRDRIHPEGSMGGGCHDGGFWRPRLPAQLAFLGHHLAG